ncbi:nuclear transport factor 2 family protein [Streptomyces sp. NPDC046909]|uniref:nuclear transport factor 2 family protein n=1 Tax=Streptomyces sp. NPDC046909 TaxID=3155617 RepID=UPI0033D4C20D
MRAAEACHRAWTGGDIGAAIAYISHDIVIDSPNGRFEGRLGFEEFTRNFAVLLKRSTIRAAYGDDTTALLFYDLSFTFGLSCPAAQHDTVRGGEIVHQRYVWDPAPFLRSLAQC